MADAATEAEKTTNGNDAAIKVEKTTNGVAAVKPTDATGDDATSGLVQSPEDLKKVVRRQLEYYFGDYNLPKDKFLRKSIEENDGGWVTMDTMLKFQRLAGVTTDKSLIMDALRGSELLETDVEKDSIRRLPSLPVPEFNEEWKKANIEKTIYCKGFNKEDTKMDDLFKFFDGYENIAHVFMRNWCNRSTKENGFKGSAFVTFKTKEDADKFMKLESVKSPEGEEVSRKWQQEYFDDKEKEREERRNQKKTRKQRNKQAKEVLAEAADEKDDAQDDSDELPTGAVLCLSGIKGEETKREDIKEALDAKFDVDPSDIAFVYFNRGDKEAKLRFKEENAAVKICQRLAEKDQEKFKVKEDELEVKALEGQEEVDFLQQCKIDIASQMQRRKGHKRNNKRRGGDWQPRGGKRQRAE